MKNCSQRVKHEGKESCTGGAVDYISWSRSEGKLLLKHHNHVTQFSVILGDNVQWDVSLSSLKEDFIQFCDISAKKCAPFFSVHTAYNSL